MSDQKKRQAYDLLGENYRNDPNVEGGDNAASFEPLVITINVTLEEFYKGRTIKLKVKDTIALSSPSGWRIWPIEKVFVVPIPPGGKQGTTIKFTASEKFPKPVHFELQESKHPYFTREGYNLLWTCELTQAQVQKGVKIKVPLLDGRVLTVNSKAYNIVHGITIPFAELGLPYFSNNHKFGDLLIKFSLITMQKEEKKNPSPTTTPPPPPPLFQQQARNQQHSQYRHSYHQQHHHQSSHKPNSYQSSRSSNTKKSAHYNKAAKKYNKAPPARRSFKSSSMNSRSQSHRQQHQARSRRK